MRILTISLLIPLLAAFNTNLAVNETVKLNINHIKMDQTSSK